MLPMQGIGERTAAPVLFLPATDEEKLRPDRAPSLWCGRFRERVVRPVAKSSWESRGAPAAACGTAGAEVQVRVRVRCEPRALRCCSACWDRPAGTASLQRQSPCAARARLV